MSKILLVTGSRSFDGDEKATEWSDELLRKAIGWYTPSLVIVGDAIGIDTRAIRMASMHALESWSFCLDGTVRSKIGGVVHTWCNKPGSFRRYPLTRNTRMVEYAVSLGRPILGLAIYRTAPRSGGTMQTSNVATKMGVRMLERFCPSL